MEHVTRNGCSSLNAPLYRLGEEDGAGEPVASGEPDAAGEGFASVALGLGAGLDWVTLGEGEAVAVAKACGDVEAAAEPEA
jgi:hypothetical protein